MNSTYKSKYAFYAVTDENNTIYYFGMVYSEALEKREYYSKLFSKEGHKFEMTRFDKGLTINISSSKK